MVLLAQAFVDLYRLFVIRGRTAAMLVHVSDVVTSWGDVLLTGLVKEFQGAIGVLTAISPKKRNINGEAL